LQTESVDTLVGQICITKMNSIACVQISVLMKMNSILYIRIIFYFQFSTMYRGARKFCAAKLLRVKLKFKIKDLLLDYADITYIGASEHLVNILLVSCSSLRHN